MDELLACPFCGARGKMFSSAYGDSNYYWVECSNNAEDCPIPELVTEDYDLKQQAIKAWNTRTSGGKP